MSKQKPTSSILLFPVTSSTVASQPPCPRVGASLSLVGSQNKVVLFGGASHETGTLNDVYTLGLDDRVWTPATSRVQPPPRYDHLGVGVDRVRVGSSDAKTAHLLVFGGAGDDENRNDLWFFDLDANEWIDSSPRMKGAAPSPRTVQSCAYLPGVNGDSDRIYLFGGGEGGAKATKDTALHCLDIDTLTWTHVKSINTPHPPPLQGHSTASLITSTSSYVVIYGGTSTSEAPTSSVYILNLSTNSWSHFEPAADSLSWPKSRFGHTMTRVYNSERQRNVFVVVGGLHKAADTDGLGGMSVLDDVWLLDITETGEGGGLAINWECIDLVEGVVGGGSNNSGNGNRVGAVDATSCSIPSGVSIVKMDVCGQEVFDASMAATAAEATKLIGHSHGEGHKVAQQARESEAVLLFGGMDLKSLSNRNPLIANPKSIAMDLSYSAPSADGCTQPFVTQPQQPLGDTNGASSANSSFSVGEATHSNAASSNNQEYNAYPSSILRPPPAFAPTQSEPVQQQQRQNNHLDALQLLSDSAAQSSAPLQYETTATTNNSSSFFNSFGLPVPHQQPQQQQQQHPQPLAVTFDGPVHQDFSNTPPTNMGKNTPPNSSSNLLNNSGSVDGDGLGDFFGDDDSSGGQSIPFLPSVQKCHLWNADKSKSYAVDLKPKIDRGFFVAEGNWTCYRRNYFQLSSTFTITETASGSTAENGGVSNNNEGSTGANGIATKSNNDTNSGAVNVDPNNPITIIANTHPNQPAKETYHLELNGSLVPITTFLTHISAHTNGSPKTAPVELVQHTSKRDKGPLTQPVPRVSEPGPSKTVFERIQFRTATSNNGRKKTTGTTSTSGATSPTSDNLPAPTA
ncbi:UNVERIFIED_CONTAM: hypothetical protein HDU68_000455, partial [Siphonaria sp. JEL0065]